MDEGGVLLLVEPLPEADALRPLLEREGLRIEAVSELERALELLRGRAFEALLVAASPTERALDLVIRARRVAPATPAIVVGGTAREMAKLVAHGAGGLIVTPIDPAEVRGALAHVRERKRIERDRQLALDDARRTRRFFEDVLRGLGEGILVVDGGGKIRYTNPEAARILGEDDDDPDDGRGDIDKPSSSAIRLRQRAVAPLLQLLVETYTEAAQKSRMIVVEEEDRKLFLDTTTNPLRDGDGRITGTVAIVRDRSSEKLLEEQLVHTERLATLGSLLAAIAHEIANPLNVITGAAEIGFEAATEAQAASRSVADPDARAALERVAADVREVLEQIKEAGVRCHTITGNLLQSSRRVPAKVREEDLNELVNKTLSFVGKYLGTDKVEVVLELDPKVPRVKLDAAQMQQAFTNLIDNAVHAMIEHQKGKAPGSKRPKLKIKTWAEAGQATVRIADEGPGISEGRLKNLWRPFYTTKTRGTGLGLYITRKVVEHQGGTIACESQVGTGTSFTIRIPL